MVHEDNVVLPLVQLYLIILPEGAPLTEQERVCEKPATTVPPVTVAVIGGATMYAYAMYTHTNKFLEHALPDTI